MSTPSVAERYAGSPAENYERYFVPSIGAPLAEDLVEAAALAPGERILDVACGTGVVARLAARAVGPDGVVAGADIEPAVLEVARKAPLGDRIEWHAAPAEALPLPDASFDVVLCQMGLQFVPDRLATLREMRRVLRTGGRLLLNVPGPTPPAFEILADALARHVGPEAAGFARAVFSLHDEGQLRGLFEEAGFREVEVRAAPKTLRLPPPADFLWQYVYGTPLAAAVGRADPDRLSALEDEVRDRWAPMVEDGALVLTVRMSTAAGRRPA